MRLLSRVAERLYWLGRYLERAEDTARLTQSFTHLVMDIPQGADLGWNTLVDILDAQPVFEQHYRAYNELNVLSFMIADESNLSGIHQSIRGARENVRTTRDVLPAEMWEHINELYLYSQEYAEKSVGRRNRHQFLDQVQARCQILSGLTITSLSRDNTFRFIALGHLLERADMTTRIIDVGAAMLLEEGRDRTTVDPLLWGNLLRSVSALNTYLRRVGPLPEAEPVVELVFKEATLPRSLKFCLDSIRRDLSRLNNSEAALRHLERARRRLSRFQAEKTNASELHQFIDRCQLDLNDLHNCISKTWFPPTPQ